MAKSNAKPTQGRKAVSASNANAMPSKPKKVCGGYKTKDECGLSIHAQIDAKKAKAIAEVTRDWRLGGMLLSTNVSPNVIKPQKGEVIERMAWVVRDGKPTIERYAVTMPQEDYNFKPIVVPMVWETHRQARKTALVGSLSGQMGVCMLEQIDRKTPIREIYSRRWIPTDSFGGLAPSTFTVWDGMGHFEDRKVTVLKAHNNGRIIRERPHKETKAKWVVSDDEEFAVGKPVPKMVSRKTTRVAAVIIPTATIARFVRGIRMKEGNEVVRFAIKCLMDAELPVVVDTVTALCKTVMEKPPCKRAVQLTFKSMGLKPVANAMGKGVYEMEEKPTNRVGKSAFVNPFSLANPLDMVIEEDGELVLMETMATA